MTEIETDIWNEIPDEYEPELIIYTANQWN